MWCGSRTLGMLCSSVMNRVIPFSLVGDWGEGNLKRGGIGERSFFPGASAEERELFVIRTVEERVVSVTVPRRT